MIKLTSSVIAGLVSLGLLGACSTASPAPAAAADLSAELGAFDAPESWAFSAEEGVDYAHSWAEIVDDETLEDLILEALANNPSLRVSAERVAQAEALLAQSRATLSPFIGATLAGSGDGAVEGGDADSFVSAGLAASWEVDLWGAIRSDTLRSTYELENLKAVYRSSREALIASVARAYISAIEARQQAELSEATLAAQEETLRIVTIRYDLGSASRADLVLAESDTATARDSLAVTQAAETSAILALQTLLGRYPDGGLQLAPDMPVIRQVAATGGPGRLIQRRPDILAAEYQVLSAFSAVRTARAQRWPDLSLQAGLDGAASDVADLFDPAVLVYSIGARLAGTLFDGGLTKARIDNATAVQREALALYGQTVLDSFLDVESTLQSIEVLNARFVYVQQAAAAAREALDLAEVKYKAGAIDLLDVLTVRQRSLLADRTLISLERQRIDARLALYLALGGAGDPIV